MYVVVNQASAEDILERRLFKELISSTDGYLTPKDVLTRLNVLQYIYTSGEPSKASNQEKQLIFRLISLPDIETCSEQNRDIFERLLRSQKRNSKIHAFVKLHRDNFVEKCTEEHKQKILQGRSS